jgi:hypothetical protein
VSIGFGILSVTVIILILVTACLALRKSPDVILSNDVT